MEANEVSALAYFINGIGMLFALTLIFGVMIKLSQILSAVLAYPVYLALYTFEWFVRSSRKDLGRRFFMLNIPKANPKRYFMNMSAVSVVIFMLPNVMNLHSYLTSAYSDEVKAKILTGMFMGTGGVQITFNVLAAVSIIIIYCISYFSEMDERDPMDKIETLSVPSLWSGIFKN